MSVCFCLFIIHRNTVKNHARTYNFAIYLGGSKNLKGYSAFYFDIYERTKN